MAHSVSEAAEQILDKEFKVLDKGFVRLVDYMGSDDRIVQSARVSYGDGTKSYRADAALIDYLLRNKHTSPFEQVILTFHVKLPIFVARQWIRHRTARLNEISGRYSVMKDDFYVPELADISIQSTDNKQGRGEALSEKDATGVQNAMSDAQKVAYDSYLELVDKDIARELARINLPLSLYTEWYWQIDLHNLFHFIELRLHSHAQKEIRDYAEVLLEIAKAVAPLASESFERHVQNSVTFSNAEMQELKRRLAGESAPDEQGLSGKVLERFEEKLK